MRFPASTAWLIAATLLAGCSGAEDPEDGSPAGAPMGEHGGHDNGTHLLAPQWAVGDYWTLESPQGGTFTYAVSGESGGDWVVDTDNANNAFFDAQGDISFLGKVRKADMAGSQGAQRVEFLRFPLQPNMTWTTTWDGAPVTVQATKVADGKADLHATRADGTTYATYTYSDKSRYFSRFAFYDPSGTAVGFEWSLQKAGKAFGGDLVRYSLDELFRTEGSIPTGKSTNFEVAPGYTDIYFVGTLDCTAGAVAAAVGPFQGPAEDRGYSQAGQCPLQSADSYPIAAPTAAEQWGALVTGAPTTAGTLDLVVYGRTLVQFQVGSAPPPV